MIALNTLHNNNQSSRRRRVHSAKLRHQRSQPHRTVKPTPAVPAASNTMNDDLQQSLVLPHPSASEVDPSHIAAAFPELQNVAPQYIREKLLSMAPQMYSSLSSVRANPPRHALPTELEIVIDNTSCCPTHMLAIYSSTSLPNQTRQVTMYPTHHLVLASYCANLPVFPPSDPSLSGSSSSTQSTVTIPVVSLPVPSPHTFPLLHAYLYNKSSDNLFAALFSPSGPDAPAQQEALAYGLWSNAYALGVVDEPLFILLDLVWRLAN